MATPVVDADKAYMLDLLNENAPIDTPFVSFQTAVLYALFYFFPVFPNVP